MAVEDYVDRIDDLIEDVFGDLELVAQTTPEVETDSEHQWRIDSDLAGDDDVLPITTADKRTFNVEYTTGPSAFDPSTAAPIVFGTIVVDDQDVVDFDLTIDLDAVSEGDMSGEIVIAEMPLAGGERELWYDFHAVDLGDGIVEDARTTYWEWSDEDSALEMLLDDGDVSTTVYARWNGEGGRYDHHAGYNDPEFGFVDDMSPGPATLTPCWSPA
ncbi:MAG: hypothetical protein ACKV2T_08130 [Kofleriaceae bacterium]